MPASYENIGISDTMARAKFMYEDGYNAAEIAKALKRTRQYIIWSLRVQGVSVDELKISPNGKAGKKFAREWNKTMKMLQRFLCMLLIVMALAYIPAEAATVPADVKAAAKGTAQCFVIKVGKDGRGTGYMMRKTKAGKYVCDRSGAVILGKDQAVYRSGHYSFYRNRNIEKRVMTWTKDDVKYRQRYTSFIECAEGAAFDIMVHSYVEYKQDGVWKTGKGPSKNRNGLAMCRTFAEYLWSCADPGCKVVIIWTV